MPQFYFDLHECGKHTPDEEGQDLADLESARTVAILSARHIMAEEVRAGTLCVGCHIDIFDVDRTRLAHIPFGTAIVISGLPAA